MTYKGFSREDGSLVSEAYIDGYAFGDRLLENVIFKVQCVDGVLVVAPNSPGDEKYLQDLNRDKWVKAALHHAIHAFAEGLEFSESPDGGEDLYGESTD